MGIVLILFVYLFNFQKVSILICNCLSVLNSTFYVDGRISGLRLIFYDIRWLEGHLGQCWIQSLRSTFYLSRKGLTRKTKLFKCLVVFRQSGCTLTSPNPVFYSLQFFVKIFLFEHNHFVYESSKQNSNLLNSG